MAVPNSSYATDFIATTLNNFESEMRSEILQQTVLLNLAKEHFMEEKDGGAQISVPIVYDDNDTFKSYEQDDDLDLSMMTGATVADYPWRQYAGSIVVSGIDLFRNGRSKSQIVDLLQYKVKQLVDSVSYKMTHDMLAAQAGKNMNGLPDLIASASNTVGGISGATYSWWQNTSDTTATFGSTTVGNGIQRMIERMHASTRLGKSPDLILTSAFVFGQFENALVANQRFVGSDNKWGFDMLQFKGAPLFWDDQVTSGDMYFIRTEHIKLVVGKGANFVLERPVPPANKDISIWRYILYCNLIAKARRTSSKLYGITA